MNKEINEGEVKENEARGLGQDSFKLLPLELIDKNPHQPRKVFEESKLRELAESIRLDGVVQPLLVKEHQSSPGRYVLVAGERRYRACQMLGKKEVPVLVKRAEGAKGVRMALIENIQRADLNPIEEALAFESLIEDFGLTQEVCAQQVGKDRSTVANLLRILKLPDRVKSDLMAERYSAGHAKALLSCRNEEQILKVRDLIIKKQLSVRQVEQLCKSLQKGGTKSREDKNIDPDLEYLVDSLRSRLRTKVKLAGTSQRGRIEISFFSPSELERIISLIGEEL